MWRETFSMASIISRINRSLSFGVAIVCAIACSSPVISSSAMDGFEDIFDGRSLAGWEGDSSYWRVEDSCIIGEITPAKKLENNSFLIWRGGVTEDFELKAEYLISENGNSGINYRSQQVDGIPFGIKGYQADIDGKNTYTGLNYEERGRGFLASRGEQAKKESGKEREITANLGSADSLKALLRTGEWNAYHLIVKDNIMQHYTNDILMSEFTDNDTVNRKFSGLLALQLHTGPPMKVAFRNIRIKRLNGQK